MKVTSEIVVDQLMCVINKILFLKKKRLFQFEGIQFYPSEIHLMLLVNEKNATNVTRIAGQLGVTKGAVSQTLSRLEHKGVLVKTKDPYKKNELTLSFTPFGRKVFIHYREHSKEIFERHNRYMKNFTTEEKETIQRFLIEVEKAFDVIG